MKLDGLTVGSEALCCVSSNGGRRRQLTITPPGVQQSLPVSPHYKHSMMLRAVQATTNHRLQTLDTDAQQLLLTNAQQLVVPSDGARLVATIGARMLTLAARVLSSPVFESGLLLFNSANLRKKSCSRSFSAFSATAWCCFVRLLYFFGLQAAIQQTQLPSTELLL